MTPTYVSFKSQEIVNVTLYGKKDFADFIKLGILRRGDCPGLMCGPDVITMIQGDSERGENLMR